MANICLQSEKTFPCGNRLYRQSLPRRALRPRQNHATDGAGWGDCRNRSRAVALHRYCYRAAGPRACQPFHIRLQSGAQPDGIY